MPQYKAHTSLKMWNCFPIPCSRMSERVLLLAGSDTAINVRGSSCKLPVSLVRLQWHFNCFDRLSKNAQIPNFMKIRPVGIELFHADRQTDWGTENRSDQANSRVAQFCECAWNICYTILTGMWRCYWHAGVLVSCDWQQTSTVTPTGKITLRRPKQKWKDSIKMQLRVTVWYGAEWTNLTENRDKWWADVSTVMNILVQWHEVRFCSSWGTVTFSRTTLLHGVILLHCVPRTTNVSTIASDSIVRSKGGQPVTQFVPAERGLINKWTTLWPTDRHIHIPNVVLFLEQHMMDKAQKRSKFNSHFTSSIFLPQVLRFLVQLTKHSTAVFTVFTGCFAPVRPHV
jgi:hypothetical protein